MKQFAGRDYLAVYSGAVTAVLLVLGLSAFAPAKKKAMFSEIDVERINLVEPDGTPRMIVSNRARFPGLIFRGKERPHDRRTTGILFFNDEGTENGGLIFGGSKDKDGKVQSGGSLTFDQYEQDQVVQVSQSEESGERGAGLRVNDRPDAPIDFESLDKLKTLEGAARKAEEERLAKSGAFGQNRVFVGKKRDRSAEIALKDAQGRERIVIKVAPDGSPSLKFLDENGKVVSELPQGKGR